MPGSLSRNGHEPGTGPNVVVPACVFAAILGFVGLYVLDRALYFSILGLWAFSPFKYPFIDAEYIGEAIKCWHQGVDIYLSNPCDELGRLFDYSPLWLRMSFWPTDGAWVNPTGLCLDGLFALSLAILPRARQPGDYVPIILCVLSPVTFYAMERGNVDLLMFALIMLAVLCVGRDAPRRLPGYGAILLAALLKFYPLAVMVLVLRERPRSCALVSLVSLAVLAGFIWTYDHELSLTLSNIPRPSIFLGAFGAIQLPIGSAFFTRHMFVLAGLDVATVDKWLDIIRVDLIILLVLFYTFFVKGSVHLAEHADFRAALDRLTQRERLCLVTGAALMCGCFLTGRNIDYRSIFILMAMPSLLTLARTPAAGLARVFRLTCIAAVFLMWFPIPMQQLSDRFGDITNDQSIPTSIFWLLREATWWCFIAVLGGVLIRFVADSPLWLDAARLLRKRQRPAATGCIAVSVYPKNRSNHVSTSAGDSSAM
jgi:hypothetical protein